MQKSSSSPFAARPFTARTSSDYPSSLKRTLSRQQSYFSLTDPYLAKYFAAKAAKAHGSFSDPSWPVSRTNMTRQTSRKSLTNTKAFVTYLVTVKTGSGTDNGTSGRIFVTLSGEHRKIGRQRLLCEGEANCAFDAGSLKKFRVAVEESKDIGSLKYVTIEVCLSVAIATGAMLTTSFMTEFGHSRGRCLVSGVHCSHSTDYRREMGWNMSKVVISVSRRRKHKEGHYHEDT